MSYFTLGVVAFLTILAWLAIAYIVYLMRDDRSTPKPNPIIGYVTTMDEDAQGLSVGFKINESEMESDEIRTIKNATIHSVSVVENPGPGGGRITHVDGKPV